jgi:hypothetical protein
MGSARRAAHPEVAERRRQTEAEGDVVVVRFADDFIVGFTHRDEAERFLRDPRARLMRFRVELHPDKTRLVAFGRYAVERRRRRGAGKPETFAFLGFTHICAETWGGKYLVVRQTMRRRWQAKLWRVKQVLRQRRHLPIPHQSAYVRAVVQGHTRYFGVPGNSHAVSTFRWAAGRSWRAALNRRSQGRHLSWTRMRRVLDRWLPPARICQPQPWARFAVMTRGGSRMR